MVTTKQVRAVIAKHAPWGNTTWTNKTKGDTSDNRRVKCYYRNNDVLLKALRKLAGKENVRVTASNSGLWARGPGIVVKCVLG